MKKIFIGLLLFITIIANSQNIGVVKIGLSKDVLYNRYIPSVDIGQIVDDKYYAILDIAFPIYDNAPGFINFGCGPIISKKVYLIGVIGFYSPNRSGLFLNAGLELGLIGKDVVTALTMNANNGIGFKVGYKFKVI